MEHSNITKKTSAQCLRDAASAGQLNELITLVREGVSVNSRDASNNTALLYAALHGKRDCVHFLIENDADVNIANATGYTPLICASVIGDAASVKMLLDAGAETWHALKEEDGSPSETQRTALSLAKYRKHLQVVELLESISSLQPA